jgi:hypothetical protein
MEIAITRKDREREGQKITESKTCTTYTVPRLAERLGIHCHQVRYLIGTRRIPDGRVRPGSCHKVWTEAEVSQIEQWYRDYVRLDAGCFDEINKTNRRASPGTTEEKDHENE